MQKADRDTIEVNLAALVRATEYKRLMECCLQVRLLFDEMRDKIEATNDTESKRHWALFRKIQKRGPDAFAGLTAIFQRDFPDALAILRNEVSIHRSTASRPHNGTPANPATGGAKPDRPLVLKEYTETLPRATSFERVVRSTRFHESKPNEVACYPMRSRNRGVALLVNIIHFRHRPHDRRNGADVDKCNLVQLFREFGFKVLYYEDLTAAEMLALLDKLRRSEWLRRTDCFVLTLMTHGTMANGVAKVEFSEGFLDLNDIVDRFGNAQAQLLINKPKVFLFPFCRGNTLEQPVQPMRLNGGATTAVSTDAAARNQPPNENTATDERNGNGGGQLIGSNGTVPLDKRLDVIPVEIGEPVAVPAAVVTNSKAIPSMSDVKICYATAPGYEAMREPDTGSWYIESMCSVWARYAHDTPLDELLMLVGENQLNKQSQAGKIQTASNEDRGFFRKLYFNPGFYGDEATATTTMSDDRRDKGNA